MDRACEDDGDEPYDVPGDVCVCLLGCGVAVSEGGCCRKAAKKEDRKKGRCEDGIFGSFRSYLDRRTARLGFGVPSDGYYQGQRFRWMRCVFSRDTPLYVGICRVQIGFDGKYAMR